MPLKGHTKAYSLADIFQFISVNKYSGTLDFETNEGRQVVLYFFQGEIWIHVEEASIKDPVTLYRAGLIEEEAIDHGQYFAEKTGTSLLGLYIYTGLVKIKEARRALSPYLEEEMYRLFVEEGSYEFRKDDFPPNFDKSNRDQYFIFPAGSIVMEASRQTDELSRIQEKISNQIYVITSLGDQFTSKEKELAEYMDGSLDLEEIKEKKHLDRYFLYTTIQKLREKNAIRVLEPEEYLQQIQRFLEGEKYREAIYLYHHTLKLEERSEISDQAGSLLFGDKRLRSQPAFQKILFDSSIKFDATGPGVYTLFSHLFEHRFPLSLRITSPKRDWSAFVQLEDKAFTFGERGVDPFEKMIRLLVKRGEVTARDGQAWMAENVDDAASEIVRRRAVRKKYITTFLEDRFLDMMGLLYDWNDLEVQFSPPQQVVKRDYKTVQGTYGFTSNITSLGKRFAEMISYVEGVPGGREIVFLTQKAKSMPSPDTKIREFLSQFDNNLRPFESLLQDFTPRYDVMEIFELVSDNLAKGTLRHLTLEETRQMLQMEFRQENFDRVKTLLESAKSENFIEEDEYCQKVETEYNYVSSFEDPEAPQIEGELASFNLAEILQTLVGSQLTGTLTIESHDPIQTKKQTKDLYFIEGEVYLLRREEPKKREASSMFIETQAFQAVTETMSDVVSEGMMTEDEMSEELAEQVKEEIYEIFLWEGATFIFQRDALPADFINPPAMVTKLLLKTDEFLMEAISRLDLWEDIIGVIQSEKAIFHFLNPESKQQALSSGLPPQVLYLIDGTHNIDDMIRISNLRKFEVCKIIYQLQQYGYVAHLDPAKVFALAKEALQRGDIKRSQNYHIYLSKVLPGDSRVRDLGRIIEEQKQKS